jgi:hypothetical protein
LIPDLNFEALRELFSSNDFARTRPTRQAAEPAFDYIHTAQEEGANIIQDFHESMTVRGGKRYAIIADVCAFANTNGGTLYIGLSEDPKKPVTGVQEVETSIAQLEKEITNRISPPLQCSLDVHETRGKKIVMVLVPRGEDPPYAVDDNKIYVRSEAETVLAVRDEIVGLVLRGPGRVIQTAEAAIETIRLQPITAIESTAEATVEQVEEDVSPRTGVEVTLAEQRGGERYYTMRDLRNNNVVKNVTPKSARRLWHYAITSFANLPSDLSQAKIHWQGPYGLLRCHRQGKITRYDLIQQTGGDYRYFFGVTDDGIHGPWKSLVGQEED